MRRGGPFALGWPAVVTALAGTKIDPTLCRADRLVGHVLGAVGTLPDIFVEIEINFFLLKQLLGARPPVAAAVAAARLT